MKKGFISGLLAGLLLAGVVGAAAAAYTKEATLNFNDIKLVVAGKEIEVTDSNGNPTEPFIIDGTTYLPVGNVAKLVGYSVKWDGDTKTIALELPEDRQPVYITKTGKRYHYDDHCNGGTFFEAPLSSAISMGFTACDKCVLKGN